MKPTAVYEFYDKADELLYVGISGSLPARLEQHDRDKLWWRDVARVRVQHHDSREYAEHRERWLIREARPRWNVAHSLGYLAWSEIRASYPQITAALEQIDALDATAPGFCALEAWMGLRHGPLVGLPDEVEGLATVRLVRAIPRCVEWPCPSCGNGDE